ncbi:aldehyde dehydrogenase family protein [Mytilinidion resinicola]|uniref:Aldehyde dehydrogenase family protein n=1 Tax=Mytilinidion resinicola TaxID=574789 RepID=A0A6A6Z5V9_9PEZI|nr:aldehyde dehydrogenase family protein [Mytilinidion resinicola]KAF2816481.1 aldehyde dehydrogenase family protein [Mytilinidion resinicola]
MTVYQEPNGTDAIVVPLWINGEQKTSSSSFKVISPGLGTACWRAATASKGDVIEAIDAAQGAFPSWSKTKPSMRVKILLRAADIMEHNIDEYAGFMATEMGADIGVAKFFVTPLSICMLRDIASRISSICGTVPVCQDEGTSCIVYKEPYGVTLGIVPWNAPYVFGIRAAATAIATGNTTILKASELTPRCYWAIGKAFSEAGLPPGVLNILTCPPFDAPNIVNAMIAHPAVKKINFTGSASTGRKVARACGENLKPCLMELGGKNSAIILPDANLNKAVTECIAGSFLNAGQICMGTDRIILHAEIAQPFLAGLKAALTAMSKQPAPLPRVVSSASKDRLQSLVSSALAAGAEMVFRGDTDEVIDKSGTIFIPAILGGIKDDMEIWTQESFGPVAAYMVVQDEDEAVRLANTTEYGLSAAVFTKDLRKGLAIAKRLESGAVHINSMTIHDEPALPFGGIKSSGWGRFNAASGMEEFLVTKSVTWDD